MAALVNDRNELLYSAASRVTGANVTISPGTATSIIFPKTSTTPVPSAVTLTANTTGYISPAYLWSYRFGDSGTFTDIESTTNPTTVPLDSSFYAEAEANSLVQYKVVVSETTSNIGINQSNHILSIPIIREGVDGTSGINSVVIRLFKRTVASAPPTVTTVGNCTYVFSTSQIVGQPTDWTQTIPDSSSGAYLWQIEVPAASVSSSYTFANTLWSEPILYSQDGTPGINTALVYAYKRVTTAPTDNPGDVTYSFSTNTITTATLANNWLKTIPEGTDPLYVTMATAATTEYTDTILATEWSTPVLLAQNGVNNATVYLYSRNNNSSTAPALSTTGTATYTFTNGVLSGTIPSGWTQTIPAESNGSVIWVVQATAASNTVTDSIANTEWSTARVLGQQGSDGAAGTRGSRQLYSNNASYNSSYVYNGNSAGAASYAVKATDLIAAAVVGSTPTTPISGDTVTFTNGSTYVYTITYNPNSSAWETPGTVIDGSLLVTGSITAAKLAANTITGDKIAATTITGDKIAATTITATNMAANTITGDKIAATTITGSKIAATTITATNMAADSITAANAAIANAAVNTLQIAGNAITIPTNSFALTEIVLPYNTWTSISSLTYTSSGNPVSLVFSFYWRHLGNTAAKYMRLLKNGSVVTNEMNISVLGMASPLSYSFTDINSAGSVVTYSIELYGSSANQGGPVGVSARSGSALEVKR